MTWKQIKTLLDRLVKGEELSEAELKSLAEYQEPKLDKTKESELQAEVDRLTAEAEAKENAKLPELEQLQKENAKLKNSISNIEKERDSARLETSSLKRENAISSIASEYKFNDRDFLRYKLDNGKIDLEDKDAVKNAMEQYKKDSPQFFNAEVNGGGAGSGGAPAGIASPNAAKDRISELLKKDTLTTAESAEVIKLHSESNQQNKKETE